MLASEPSGDFLPDLGPARKAFVESLYDRIPFLDANVSCLNSATLSPEECATVLENIRGILHKIAGTAGTLGYSNEGQQAEALEIAIHIKKNNLYGDDVLTV